MGESNGYMIKGKLKTPLLVSVLVFLLPLVSVLVFAITRSLGRGVLNKGTQIVYDFQGPGRMMIKLILTIAMPYGLCFPRFQE